MPVQHKIGRLVVGQERGDFRDPFAHLCGQRRQPCLQPDVAIAVNDLAQAHLTSNRCGELEGVKSKHQLVVFDDFVGELETIGNELDGRAAFFGGRPFYSPQARFKAVCPEVNVDSETPCRVLGLPRNGRRDCAVALGKHREQTLKPLLVVGLVPQTRPLRIGIPGTRLGPRSEPGFGSAFEVSLKKRGTDSHS